jgi:hypothetical protein
MYHNNRHNYTPYTAYTHIYSYDAYIPGIVDDWVGYKSTRVVANEWAIPIGTPEYLGIDDNAFFVMWSDR